MKYAPGLMVGQLSGSTGSTTASHNRYGTYFRSRTIPVNPNSVSQAAVRAIFGGVAQAWRALTESQRTGWSSLAQELPLVDSLGVDYTLSGNAMYQKVNTLRQAVGNAIISDPPGIDSPAVITSLSVTAAGGSIDLAYTATGGTANNDIIIRASAPRSAGKSYTARSDLKQILVVAGNVVSPVDILAAYEAVFGDTWASMTGMEIVVEAFPVSQNGLPGVGFQAVGVIA